MKISITDKRLLVRSIVIMLWGIGVTYFAGTNFQLLQLNEPISDNICKVIYIIGYLIVTCGMLMSTYSFRFLRNK